MQQDSVWFDIRAMLAEGCIALGLKLCLWFCPKGYTTSLDQHIDALKHSSLREFTDSEIGTEYLRRVRERLGPEQAMKRPTTTRPLYPL